MIAVRLAVEAIESTLGQPEFESSFQSSERKSRYLQSDQLLRAYVKKFVQYEEWFARKGNFKDWWNGGSPLKALKTLCSR